LQRLRVLLGNFPPDCPLIAEIALIAHQDDACVLVSVGLDLLQPFMNIFECLAVGDIEDKQGYDGAGWQGRYFL
jgi:hypothetical protein